MGVVTTRIFWTTETASWLIWQSDLSHEGAAVLGRGVGYTTRLRLSRRFVFNLPEEAHTA